MDITKRTARRIAPHLRPDETVEHATLVETKGALGLGAVAAVVSRGLSAGVLESRAASAGEGAGGTAERFPSRSCVIAVTSVRVLVVPSDGLRFEAPALELARSGGVRVARLGRRGLGHRVVLVFADGTGTAVDVMSGRQLRRLGELVGELPHAG